MQKQKENKKVIGILQPGYLPWLGFFEQIIKSDIFVIYDDVQYDKHSWRNRNRIKIINGIQWLSIPVFFSLKDKTKIKDVKINNEVCWSRKHLHSIKMNYSKAKFFKDYIEIFEKGYLRNWEYLIDCDIYFIEQLLDNLNIKEKSIFFSSELNISSNDRIMRLIEICKHFEANIFYEGAAGKNYIDTEVFEKNGIQVIFQDYHHPIYNQLYGEFVSHLSVIDLLFNEGNKSYEIILNNNSEVI